MEDDLSGEDHVFGSVFVLAVLKPTFARDDLDMFKVLLDLLVDRLVVLVIIFHFLDHFFIFFVLI